jgi:hypothetical protein
MEGPISFWGYKEQDSILIFPEHDDDDDDDGDDDEIFLNLLKPTGHVMHHQFNIQQLYALPTLYLCVLYLSENKQRLVPLTA